MPTGRIKPPPPCGDRKAYLAHLRHHEPVDQACRDANARHGHSQRTSRRATAKRLVVNELIKRHRQEYEALLAVALAAGETPAPSTAPTDRRTA